MSAAPAEYPQIRPMFADALKAMAEGETEAEKQIVYVLNEARAALPCPAFVTKSGKSYTLHVRRGGAAEAIVGVTPMDNGAFLVASPVSGECFTADGTLALADAVLRLLRVAHPAITHAAMEVGPKTTHVEQSFSMSPKGMASEVAECFAETVKARTVASRVDTIVQLMANGLYRGKATIFSLATEWGVSPDIVREHARVAASQLIG